MTASPVVPSAKPIGPLRRIAFCITDLDMGGAEQCLVHVVRGLDRRIWSPHVYCLSRRGVLVDRLEQDGIPCTCFGWSGWKDAYQIPALAWHLRLFRPELLQTFLFHANFAGAIAGRLAGVRVIVSGIRVAEREKNWHVRLERLTRRLVTHHVCVSQAVADFAIREMQLPPSSVSVIPNGVDVERFANAKPLTNEELGAPAGTHWLISVGRLHPQKGHLLLLEAVAPLLETHPDWRLMIVGEGPLRGEIEKAIQSLRCRDQVSLLGFRDDIPRLMKTASFLVLPSLWEGLPNVVLEAQAAGLPVVAMDVEGVREVVRPGVTGLVVGEVTAAALSASMRQLMEAPESLAAMSGLTQSLSKELFTLNRASVRYADLYEKLLGFAHC